VELGWNAAEGWFKGSLTTSEYEATPKSIITSVVTKEQLKVYYRGTNADGTGGARLWVTYVARDQEAWMRRPIIEF
jgi:hypothetical protein